MKCLGLSRSPLCREQWRRMMVLNLEEGEVWFLRREGVMTWRGIDHLIEVTTTCKVRVGILHVIS